MIYTYTHRVDKDIFPERYSVYSRVVYIKIGFKITVNKPCTLVKQIFECMYVCMYICTVCMYCMHLCICGVGRYETQLVDMVVIVGFHELILV